MSMMPDSYVCGVLLTRHSPSYSVTHRRRWRRLTIWLQDPYRPELYYMRGPGPKWREKHPEPDRITVSLV